MVETGLSEFLQRCFVLLFLLNCWTVKIILGVHVAGHHPVVLSCIFSHVRADTSPFSICDVVCFVLLAKDIFFPLWYVFALLGVESLKIDGKVALHCRELGELSLG